MKLSPPSVLTGRPSCATRRRSPDAAEHLASRVNRPREIAVAPHVMDGRLLCGAGAKWVTVGF